MNYRTLPEETKCLPGLDYMKAMQAQNKRRFDITKFLKSLGYKSFRLTTGDEQKEHGDFWADDISIDYKGIFSCWPKTGEQLVLIEFEDGKYGGWLNNCKCEFILYDLIQENRLMLVKKEDLKNLLTKYNNGEIGCVNGNQLGQNNRTKFLIFKWEDIQFQEFKY